jgi:prephenate dehydrogenase
MANAKEVLMQSRRLHESLSELEKLIEQGDRAALQGYIERVSHRRGRWQMGRESDAP